MAGFLACAIYKRLLLDQEIVEGFTLLIHCFFDYSWSTALASPGFSFAVFVNVAIFCRTLSTLSFGARFNGSKAIQQFVRVNTCLLYTSDAADEL